MKKKALSLILAFVMALGMAVPALAAPAESGKIVILHTNDVHCGIDQVLGDDGAVTNMGYAGVAAYKAEMEAQYGAGNVTLVDAGDAIQGGPIGTLSKGSYIVDIMNQVGYDLAIPGNHEFDYGMDNFLSLAKEKAQYPYLCANFTDMEGKPVFDGYKVLTYGDVKVGYVGIDTPEAFTKSTPTYFQDTEGNYIYSFSQGNEGKDLYAAVQKAVDGAKAEGARYVVALGHLGTEGSTDVWQSKAVIANTTGIDVFIDGHSHEEYEQTAPNKDGKDVVLAQTGTKLANLGKIVIDTATGAISHELVSGYAGQDEATAAYVAKINEEFEGVLKQVVAKTDVALTTKDPATGDRAVRSAETNLGDLCADAYRVMLGADVAFVNGGGVRADIAAGDITYEDIINVHPFGNEACMVETTGQHILDALEMGARNAPEENGGFLQVSGLTYTIDTTVPSSVVLNDEQEFVKVDGAYRVKDVMVAGQPLDTAKTYTLASHNYMLKSGGDGFVMFKEDELLKDSVMIDNQVLINYIVDALGGVVGAEYADPMGQGRIDVKYVGIDGAAWYAEAAKYAVDQGLMSSTGNGFDPSATVTRATVFQTLYNAEGKPAPKNSAVMTDGGWEVDAASAYFTDTTGTWYSNAANWAVDAGLAVVPEDGLFHGERDVTRGEIAAILARYAAYKKLDLTAGGMAIREMADYDTLPEWAVEGMTVCFDNGILSGKPGSLLDPNGQATRAELAAMLMDLSKLAPASTQKEVALEQFLETSNAQWFRTGKTSYTIQGMMVSKDLSFTNDLEGTDYTAQPNGEDVVLKGTSGEMWIAPLAKVQSTYTKPNGAKLTADDFKADTYIDLKTKADPDANFACYVPLGYKVEVQTAWGDVLYANRPEVAHGLGDYLICNAKDGKPDLTDVWVVNGAVFPSTYDTKNGPVTGTVQEIEKYGHASLDVSIKDFEKAGFALGDTVNVSFDNGFTVEGIPYFNGYYVDNGAYMLRAYPGHETIAVCINYGKLNEEAGVDVGSKAVITLAQKEGALAVYEMNQLERTNERKDYKSDEIFANFRGIALGDIPAGVLYRTSSPVNPEIGRAAYADDLIEKAGVKTVIDLADSKEEVEGYIANQGFDSPYYKGLFEDGQVIALAMPAAYTSDEFKTKLGQGLAFLAEHEGPYAVHCNEGKDRAGFTSALLEALMGAKLADIRTDYMQSYVNYYGLKKNTDKYDLIQSANIDAMLRAIAGVEQDADLAKVDLEQAAEDYIAACGLSAQQISALKTALSTPVAAGKAA